MKRSFFTLLELMIAVTVFMMVAVALFAFSSTVSDSWSRITVERNRFNELMTLDRAMDGILSNAVPFLWRSKEDGTAVSTPFIVASQDYLRIACLHKLNDPDEGALRFVELMVNDGDLQAVYTDRPFLDWSEISEDRCTTSILATDVESITFQYADFVNDISEDWSDRLFWQDEWETEDSEREDIPLAILATVRWKDGRQESWLRRTMGTSYRERFGTWKLPVDNGL